MKPGKQKSKPKARPRRKANPSVNISPRHRTELIEWCRAGVVFEYAVHLVGHYKVEVFEYAKRNAAFAAELTKAVEEGKAADPCLLWLELLRMAYKSSTAQRMAGINNTLLSERRKVDPDFAIAALEAENQGTDYLEDVARKRGINGSDTLLMFVLKARDRQRFSDASPGVSITNNTLNIEGDGDRHELGRRLAFALRYAAPRQAAGGGATNGAHPPKPEVDTERGTADRSVPVTR